MSWSRLAEHRRQRRIVLLDELDVAREAGMRQALHVLEHHVDVDRLALDRPLVGEHLHAVDQLHDAVGLVADQPRQGAVVVVADRLLQQLRRAADARERILDLVGEHGRERGHRARGAAMGELAVHLVGDRALLQHHDHMIRPLRQRRDMQIDQALAGIARRAEIDLVFVDRGAAPAHLLDEREQGAAERHEVLAAGGGASSGREASKKDSAAALALAIRPSAATMITGCGSASSTASDVPDGSVGIGVARERVWARAGSCGLPLACGGATAVPAKTA